MCQVRHAGTPEGAKWAPPGDRAVCKRADKKRWRLAETETRGNSERAFKAYGEPMEEVLEFKYLGRILTATDDNWPAVAGNIKKAG